MRNYIIPLVMLMAAWFVFWWVIGMVLWMPPVSTCTPMHC